MPQQHRQKIPDLAAELKSRRQSVDHPDTHIRSQGGTEQRLTQVLAPIERSEEVMQLRIHLVGGNALPKDHVCEGPCIACGKVRHQFRPPWLPFEPRLAANSWINVRSSPSVRCSRELARSTASSAANLRKRRSAAAPAAAISCSAEVMIFCFSSAIACFMRTSSLALSRSACSRTAAISLSR